MIPFYETTTGKIFFESQLPKLISALTDLSVALKSPAPAYIVKPEVPEGFLTELYHGNYDPSDLPDTVTAKALMPEIIEIQQQLRESVSADVWAMIDRYRDLLSVRGTAEREQAFAAGFQSAMTMLAAGLTRPMVAEKM